MCHPYIYNTCTHIFIKYIIQRYVFIHAYVYTHTHMHIQTHIYYIQNVTTSDLLYCYLPSETTAIAVCPSSSHASLQSSLIARMIIFKAEARSYLSLAYNQ